MGRFQRVSVAKRTCALALACIVFINTSPVVADPGDIFSIAAPAIGTEPPKATSIADGDASVATQTGAMRYGYTIEVPPGRNGMSPRLALQYSSQGAIYGEIAAGWSLSIPIITLDTSRGRLDPAPRRFTSSLAGGRPLVPVTEPVAADVTGAFRAQNDTTFMRYERVARSTAGYWWRARALDGSVYYFGNDSNVSTCTIVGEEYAPLTRHVDHFGNAVDYFYEVGFGGECRLASITWGQNATAGLQSFAIATFNYTRPMCAGEAIGGQTSYRSGTKIITGGSQLDSISIKAHPPGSPTLPDHERLITLMYSATASSCTAKNGAVRLLTSIQESAWGIDSPRVDLPAVRLTYGDPSAPFFSWEQQTLVPWYGIDNTYKNLGWGLRASPPDFPWPTVEAMMLDVDGDGLLDRVVNAPQSAIPPSGPDPGQPYRCRAVWYRNTGTLGSGAWPLGGYIPLPTLKWKSDVGDPWGGGQDPNLNERCALNYQQTFYTNSQNSTGFWCPPGYNACPAAGYCSNRQDCGDKSTPVEATILAYRWVDINGDGFTDVIASPVKGGLNNYNFRIGIGYQGFPDPPAEPALLIEDDQWPACPSAPYTSSQNFALDAYTVCNGMFPWFVFLNKRDGTFGRIQPSGRPFADQVLYQPMPLEASNGASSITSRPISPQQGTLDIDGDGWNDAVTGAGTSSWSVYRNDHTGKFVPATGSTPFSWAAGASDQITKTNLSTLVNSEGLHDINGDGLADHWEDVSTSANFEMNDGLQFRTPGGTGELTTSVRPANDGLATDIFQQGQNIVRGRRTDTNRTLDIDGDGRADVIQAVPNTNPVIHTAYFSQGSQFGGAAGQTGNENGLRRMIVGSDSMFGTNKTWELRSDMIDLDGDGILDSASFGDAFNSGTELFLSNVVTTQPPRLLISIDNQRGAVTTVAYAPMSKSSVVEQHPATGKSMPRTQWVVEKTTTVDSLANTTSETKYKYIDPKWSADDDGKFGFRGFEEVQTTAPSLSVTVEKFSYSPDWSGRLATTLVKPAPTEATVTDEVRSIDDTTWQELTLFAGAIKTYHATTKDHWTCTNGQIESACRGNTATRTRSVSALSPLTSSTNGPDPTQLLWQETTSRRQAGASLADGDRSTFSAFILDSNATHYHLMPTVTTSEIQTLGVGVVYAKTQKTWDASYRVPITDETWFELADATRAIEKRDYDMQTGNVVNHWKPEQNAATSAKTIYQFDARKLFVVTETNELGHVYDYKWEYGTGTKLETMGPNNAQCAAAVPPNCPAGTPPREQHRIKVDGLGRMIERWDTFSDDGNIYTPRLVETNAYVDTMPNATTPTSVTHQNALYWNGSTSSVVYGQDKTEIDGLGRPKKITVYVFGSAPADQVTTYTYRNDGTLASVSVPDPTANVLRTSFVTA